MGSPKTIQIITDQQPLCSIFNGKKKGSVRTERIKSKHQDNRYNVVYQKGKLHQSNYISRHAKPLEKMPLDIQMETEENNNLLYMLHMTPIIDCTSLATVSKETEADHTLRKIKTYLKKNQKWIPKNEIKSVQMFREIMSELTLTGNGIILKGERIVLPETLQIKAIELAQSGLQRRLRYHFFFHGMDTKVKEFVESCQNCQANIDKKTIPDRNWETVAVDLFGPMSSSKHIVVAYDLGSRYPAAKLVKSTKADAVIPVLEEIYDTYGNPDVQINDNGPPFSSNKMKKFALERDITLRNIPPLHPSSNPAETFMKTIGKGMKIA